MSKMNEEASRREILWCYKKELGFSSHKKKRMKEIHKLVREGLYDNSIDEPFDVFIASNDIRYCYYKETENILGRTFNTLILQDFESITPNILCRTIETVEGGGIVFLLVKSMTSLKQMYTLAMDVHKRFRTESHQHVEPRFNERFLLSLARSENVLFMDDELNLLTISSKMDTIAQVQPEDLQELKKLDKELQNLKDSLKDSDVVGPLVNLCLTLDQAKAVMVYVDTLNQKNQLATVFLQASRGRGKSAAMGFGLAAALAKGLSTIFVTAPAPENLGTFFEFCIKGLEALGFQENLHFEVVRAGSKNMDCIVRLSFHAKHKQVVQYFSPTEVNNLHFAELLLIDEAAAIPLPLVKKMIGKWPIFISSTVHGYEGTGRSLSLKLVKEMRQSSDKGKQRRRMATSFRPFNEVKMEEPIRYAREDPIEAWLYDLLCLRATTADPIKSGFPSPENCELYLVNKDTLFSYNKSSESFLAKLMGLFVASHYKNSPNDLQMLSDAPAHSVLVLMGPLKKGKKGIPDILCAVQIALEGDISQEKVVENSSRGIKPAGDLIPWTLSEQFLDRNFPKLNGLRVVRIAVHPQAQGMGYGSKALQLMKSFFMGELASEEEQESFYSYRNYSKEGDVTKIAENDLNQKLKPRKKLKPLMKNLSEVKPPQMHYLGTSFGLTKPLFRFWKKAGYKPVYLKQRANSLTGEFSCIMLLNLQRERVNEDLTVNENWLSVMRNDFERRFSTLLSFSFREIDLQTCLNILNARLTIQKATNNEDAMQDDKDQQDSQSQQRVRNILDQYILTNLQNEEVRNLITLLDLKRLQSYSSNLIDFYMIRDLIPIVARLFFLKAIDPACRLSQGQAVILAGLGLQHREIESVCGEIDIEVSQALALFNKSIKRISKYIKIVLEAKHVEALNFDQVSYPEV